MNPLEYFHICLTKKYSDFSGRARRKEFWSYAICFYITAYLLLSIDQLIFGEGVYISGLIFILLSIVPNLSVTIRRLHDTNNSGWLFLLFAIPCIGSILLLIFGLLDSHPHPNKWGPNPKLPIDLDDDFIKHLVD